LPLNGPDLVVGSEQNELVNVGARAPFEMQLRAYAGVVGAAQKLRKSSGWPAQRGRVQYLRTGGQARHRQ
jgi:hypothetical protein